MSEFGRNFDAAQREYDNRMPEAENPMRVCIVCRKPYNEDTQELDSKGKDICDDCLSGGDSDL